MTKMKRLASLPIAIVSACLMTAPLLAAGGDVKLESSDIDRDNVNSLRRGAANFMNYCSGCHSAQYVRYKTIGRDLDLSEDMLVNNLMFNAEKTFEVMRASMPAGDAARWYGTPPPDLSLIARSKGVDRIYNFLKGFYVAEGSPTGVDNRVLSGTSMPHVLWQLQGYQKAIFTEHSETNDAGEVSTTRVFAGFEQLTAGSMDSEDFDAFVRDTVNFLAYISEPIRSERRKLGVWVIMFLIFFLIIARMLKKQIWKDVN